MKRCFDAQIAPRRPITFAGPDLFAFLASPLKQAEEYGVEVLVAEVTRAATEAVNA